MQKQNDFYVCKRLRLCHFLLMKGFSFDSYRPDKYNPKFLVWIFKNSQNSKQLPNIYVCGLYEDKDTIDSYCNNYLNNVKNSAC